MLLQSPSGFSSDVRLRLTVDGDEFNVAAVGPTTVHLRGEYKAHPPGEAVLTIYINDFVEHQKVMLPNGVSLETDSVEYSRLSV